MKSIVLIGIAKHIKLSNKTISTNKMRGFFTNIDELRNEIANELRICESKGDLADGFTAMRLK